MANKIKHSEISEEAVSLRTALLGSAKVVGGKKGNWILAGFRVGDTKERHLFNANLLLQNQVDELQTLQFRLPSFTVLLASELKILARRLVSEATSEVIVIEEPGFRDITVHGTTYKAQVYSGEVSWVGNEPPIKCILLGEAARVADQGGSLEDWNAKIGKYLGSNPYLLVAVAAALSAAMLRRFRLQPLQLLLFGRTTTGKSVTLRMVQSIFAKGDELPSASATVTGLRQQLAGQPDRPSVMDELRQLNDPKGLVQLLFDLGNRAGRTVGTQAQMAFTGPTLATVLITSNERTLAEMTHGTRIRLEGGLTARVLELRAAAPHGMFHRLPKKKSAAEFAQLLESRSKRYFGTVWPAWSAGLAEHESEVSETAEEAIDTITSELLKPYPKVTNVQRRLIHGLAGWKFAIRLARKWKIIDLGKAEIDESFTVVVKQTLANQGVDRTPADQRAIDAVRRAIIDRRADFIPWECFSAEKNHTLGYRKLINGSKFYLFHQHAIDDVVAKVCTKEEALTALAGAKLLRTNGDGKHSMVMRVPVGTTRRFYVVSAAILDGS